MAVHNAPLIPHCPLAFTVVLAEVDTPFPWYKDHKELECVYSAHNSVPPACHLIKDFQVRVEPA